MIGRLKYAEFACSQGTFLESVLNLLFTSAEYRGIMRENVITKFKNVTFENMN